MDLETRQTLIEKMYEVIKEEALPVPSRILIRQPTRGGSHSSGRCLRSLEKNDFKISVTVTKPEYIRAIDGRFFDRRDKTIRYKFMGWHDVSRERVIEVAAHEIAHLKFWSHDAQHVSYMNHLIKILTVKLEGWNIEQ